MPEKLHVIAGAMFSGKTGLLLEQVTRAEIAGRQVQVFKPIIDNRWGKTDEVCSHSGSEHKATSVKEPVEILDHLKPDTQIVAIDEIQFFKPEQIIEIVNHLLDLDKKVIVAGLPTDFRGEPFGAMPTLLAMADQIDRLTAICTFIDDGDICGQEATRTQRLVSGLPATYSDPIVVIGAEEQYQARCPKHHQVPGKPMSIFTRDNL
jgi:thymidine kinase